MSLSNAFDIDHSYKQDLCPRGSDPTDLLWHSLGILCPALVNKMITRLGSERNFFLGETVTLPEFFVLVLFSTAVKA